MSPIGPRIFRHQGYCLARPQRSTMRPRATFSFHFLKTFIFSLSSSIFNPHRIFFFVPPSFSSLLPPRPSFLLVPSSSLFLFLPRPARSQSLRIRKRPFFINFDESVTDRPTDRRTDQRTNGRTDQPTDRRKERPLIEMRGRI